MPFQWENLAQVEISSLIEFSLWPFSDHLWPKYFVAVFAFEVFCICHFPFVWNSVVICIHLLMGGFNWTGWFYHNQFFFQFDGLLNFLKGQFDTCAIFDDLLNFYPESTNLVSLSLTNVCL